MKRACDSHGFFAMIGSMTETSESGQRPFTEEKHTTGALGAAFYDPPEFNFSWFQTIGVEAGALRNISVERSDAFPDTGGVWTHLPRHLMWSVLAEPTLGSNSQLRPCSIHTLVDGEAEAVWV